MSGAHHDVAFAFLEGLGLSPADAPALTRVLARCLLRTAAAGSAICREGQEGDELYFVAAGALSVHKNDHLGERRDLTVLSAPVMVGHMGLVDGVRRSATCVATEDCTYRIMGKALYRELVGSRGEEGDLLRRMILASMVQQLDRASSELSDLVDRLPPEASPLGDDEGSDAHVLGALKGWKR